jgi:hypothetical protein
MYERAGYRWLTGEGLEAGPRHRSLATAARYLARCAREPRTRPAPTALVVEWVTPASRRVRRRPLTGEEREALQQELSIVDVRSLSARAWVKRQARQAGERRRRRAALGRLTGRLERLPERRAAS